MLSASFRQEAVLYYIVYLLEIEIAFFLTLLQCPFFLMLCSMIPINIPIFVVECRQTLCCQGKVASLLQLSGVPHPKFLSTTKFTRLPHLHPPENIIAALTRRTSNYTKSYILMPPLIPSRFDYTHRHRVQQYSPAFSPNETAYIS
jgi:hypothetical protein